MLGQFQRDGDFTVSHTAEPSSTLVAGFSTPGLAGLTAVDYLVDHLNLTETGHITAEGLPAITPFEQGRPRHHTRLFSREDLDLTALVGELYVPPRLGGSFGDAVLDWADEHGVREVVVAAGVPVPHAPDDHRTFYVATDDYREHRLADATVPPMGTGFLDGVNAAIMERGLGSDLEVCLLVTPVHLQAPDVEAAIRLVETLESIYGLEIDASPLQSFAAEVEAYYRDLAERMAAQSEAEPEDVGADRMYM